MVRIATLANPAGHAAEGDERIRTAEQAPGADSVYEQRGKVWRPLLMGEHPPPGPTKLGGSILDKQRPILVYAHPLPKREARDA